MNKKTMLRAVISILLISYLVWQVDLGNLGASLGAANLYLLFLVYFSSVFGVGTSAYKWMLLIQAQGIRHFSFFRLCSIYSIGMFFNHFLPTEVGGDIYRSYEVGRVDGRQVESLAAIATDRLTGFVGLLIYLVIGLFLNWSLAQQLHLTLIVAGIVAGMGLALAIFLNKGFLKWLKGKLSYPSFARILNKLQSLYKAFYLYRNNLPVLSQALLISLAFQLYAIWFPYACMLAVSIDLSFSQVLLIVPAVSIIGLLPFTINGIGLREGAYVVLLSQLGVSPADALAAALLYRIGVLLPSLVGGIFYMLQPTEKLVAQVSTHK